MNLMCQLVTTATLKLPHTQDFFAITYHHLHLQTKALCRMASSNQHSLNHQDQSQDHPTLHQKAIG